MTTDNRPLWTVAQLAEATGLSAAAVQYHCRQGALRDGAFQLGRAYMITDRVAQRFIAARSSSEAGP